MNNSKFHYHQELCISEKNFMPTMEELKNTNDDGKITKQNDNSVLHAIKLEELPLPDDGLLTLLENLSLKNCQKPSNHPKIAPKNVGKNPESEKCNEDKVKKFLWKSYSKTDYKKLNLQELRDIADKLKLEYDNDEDTALIEELTQKQSNSIDWHKLRTGRITASVFKSVCRTTIEKPSIMVIKNICWPETTKFHSKSVAYGRRHEPDAYDEFCDFMHMTHKNFICRTNGLVINKDYPYFGASPDGICTCDCCGASCLEIKCPYSLRDGKNISELLKLKDPYLMRKDVDEEYELNKKHSYYYQVQMQMFVCNVEFCNFFIWSESESLCLKVLKDNEFWRESSKRAVEFSKKVIIPEILGHYYTRE